MNDDPGPPTEVSDVAMEVKRTRRNMRGAIAFGIVMATIEMGALLYFAYC